jgi:hypothetical protein
LKVLSLFSPRGEAKENHDKRHSSTLSSDRYSSHAPPKYIAGVQPEPTGLLDVLLNVLFEQTWKRFEHMTKCKELEVEDNTKSKVGEN